MKLSKNPGMMAAAVASVMMSIPTWGNTQAPSNSHVTRVASDQLFIQNAVIFMLDQGTSDCAAGSYIYYYSSNTDVLKTLYATVLAAYEAGTPLLVHFSTGCTSDGLGAGT